LAVAGFVLREQHGISEDQRFRPEAADLIGIVKQANARQLRLLKDWAEELIDISDSPSDEIH
jgi:hypothetical protein